MKREKQDTSEIMASVGTIGEVIKVMEEKVKNLEKQIYDFMMITPNLVSETVKIGKDETENREVRRFLEPTKFDFTPADHTTLGEKLDILDFSRAAKITGTRFVVYKGLGARLERALIQFMMDLHANKQNYVEIIPPFIVNRASMLGTGQFPKFEEDAFAVGEKELDWFLNPTAEVPTINMHRDEIIDGAVLPLKYTSFTTAFRAEAGSAGKDTRGILRQHQFNKVELIKITKLEESYENSKNVVGFRRSTMKLLKYLIGLWNLHRRHGICHGQNL